MHKIIYKNKADMPINRLIEKGPSALSMPELISIIINGGENVMDVSNSILTRYSMEELGCVSPEALQELHGIGRVKASQISAVFEIAKRYSCDIGSCDSIRLSSPEAVFKFLYPKVRGMKKEVFTSLLLDTKNNLIREDVVSIGSLNANIVHPREVFKTAIENSAAAIIVSHNHPSGDPNPSQNDIDITRKLVETGRIVGIELYDHIIIGDGRYLSLKESNLM